MASGALSCTRWCTKNAGCTPAVFNQPKGPYRQSAAELPLFMRTTNVVPRHIGSVQAALPKTQASISTSTGSPLPSPLHKGQVLVLCCGSIQREKSSSSGQQLSRCTEGRWGENRLSVKDRQHRVAFKAGQRKRKPCRVVEDGRVAEGAAEVSRDFKKLEAREEDLQPLESTEAGNLVLKLRDRFNIDDLWWEILVVSFPALLALAADPVASLFETSLLGKLGPAQLAAAGVSINVFNTLCKLFNFPLLNVTTSFVAEAETQRQRTQETNNQSSERPSRSNSSSRPFSNLPEEDLLSDHSYLRDCTTAECASYEEESSTEGLRERRESSGSASTSADSHEDKSSQKRQYVRMENGAQAENGLSSNGRSRQARDTQTGGFHENELLDSKPVNEAVSASIIVGATLGIVESLILGLGASHILGLYGANSEMMGPASMYLALRAIGAPALVVSLAVSGAFRGFGDTKTPLYAQVAGNVLNVALLPLFMFSFGWGIAGAATATVLAQYVQMAILLFFIAKRCRLVPGKWRELKFRRFLGAGGVLLGRTLASLFTMSLSTSMAARTGTASMAAHQICIQVWLAASLLSDSVALAGQTILARAFAQKDTKLIDTVARRIMWLGLLMGGGMAAVFVLGQYAIPLAFTHDPSVLAIIASLIPFIVLTQPINALAFVWDGLHYGASDFVFSAQVMVLAAVPAMAATYFLPQYFGIRGVWAGLAILMSVRALLGVGRYATKSGPWEKLRELDV